MFIHRAVEEKLLKTFRSFPVVVMTGPRQAGKTTILRNLFPKISYVSLEDLDIRSYATDDPRGFLANYPPPVIFDEVQHTPDLLSYIQTKVDEAGKQGLYILSGSQNFLLLEKIAQTLAGRAGIIQLPPLTMQEIKSSKNLPKQYEQLIYKGLYPRVWDITTLTPSVWYSSYIQTYIERDVRSIKGIADLGMFQKFLKLCAGRTGQILNLSSLANDTGITHNTARAWISILEASYIVFLLKPYYKSFNKRLIKSPKLYFYDTGLVSSLLGIDSRQQVMIHPLKGALFETLIISELVKHQMNAQKPIDGYYFRDKKGMEIDYLCDKGAGKLSAVEIKAGSTVASDYFTNLNYFRNLTHGAKINAYVVYGGEGIQKRSDAIVLPWNMTDRVLES